VVPQAVAYAQIAELPPQAGLSSAFAGPLGYALAGTSHQLMVTPTSSAAAISAALVTPLAAGDAVRFLELSAALAILTGIVFLALGWLKLGFVSQFLALSVQVGFMFGLGMVITVGQIPKVLGITAPEGDFFPSLWYILTHLGEAHLWSVILGVASLAVLVWSKYYRPSFPAALFVVAFGILVTAFFGLADRGVEIVGAIPRGLPLPSIPHIGWSELVALLPPAILLSVMGYAETASVAQDLATRHHYEIKPNRELTGIGVANVLSGLFQGFMVAGGASQSAANERAGAMSQLASIIVSVLTLLTAFALTPLFYYLPQAILGAIVINAVMGFFRVGELQRIYYLRRDSFALAMLALISTLFLGVLPGLVVAVTVSIIMLLIALSRANGSLLGKAPDSDVYGDLALHEEYRGISGMMIFRMNAPMLAINARRLRELVVDAVRQADPPPKVVLLDMGMNPDLDIESVDLLAEIREELGRQGISLWLGNVHAKVGDMLRRSEYAAEGTQVSIYPSIPTAVETFQNQ
jgi:high affinity sulfate transporter 1